MNIEDVVDLLTIIAVGDHRTIGESDAMHWHNVLGHLDANDCMEAIEMHRREHPGVWLEPGHILRQVRAKIRDRLDRADPDERPTMITAQGIPRDKFGAIDKSINSAGEQDYPADWTAEERMASYWDKVRAFRDNREYTMARDSPGRLLKDRPAGGDARASIMAAFTEKKFGVDLDSAERVDPLTVKCPHCKAKVRAQCTVASESEPLRSVVAHPSRLELAAQQAGYPEEVVDRIVGSAQRRQARLVQETWTDRDRASMQVNRRETEVADA